MLLEHTTLARRLAEIVATSMPGHGGGIEPPTPDAPDVVPEPAADDDKGEQQPS